VKHNKMGAQRLLHLVMNVKASISPTNSKVPSEIDKETLMIWGIDPC
jgi:hypothetical protein